MDTHPHHRRFRHLVVLILVLAASLVAPAGVAAAAPTTRITAGPDGPIASRSATFAFHSRAKQATFQCRMDGSAWKRCTSPRTYRRLDQGAHTFRVRARRDGKVDRTPAQRRFTVDTVGPETTITGGPEGLTDDHTPTFEFAAPGAASFTCTLDGTTYAGCASPFTAPSDLTDDDHVFTVAAADALGNIDRTPASRAFAVDTPIIDDLATAEQAAALFFPESASIDVPAICNPQGVSIDCPGEQPIPPAEQVAITSTREVDEVPGTGYDLTADLGVTTLVAPVVSYMGVDCSLTLTSAPGAQPTWPVGVRLTFPADPVTGERRIEARDVVVAGVEEDDWSAQGNFLCSSGFITDEQVTEAMTYAVEGWLSQVGNPMCAAPGPAYLGPCPQP